jgi:iron(III) transport system substrate-binding protein
MIGQLCRLALLVAIATFSTAASATPSPSSVTPELVEAAKREGKVVFYTSIELHTAKKIARAFEAAYPGITVQIERNGCERLFQRLAQERASGIRVADAIDCSDPIALFHWKKQGWLAPFVPVDVAEKWPAEARDPDGCFATERFTLAPIAYNTNLVKPADAPKSFADLLDKKWNDKMVGARPGYSGTIVTAVFALSRYLGWDFLKKLGGQNVTQVLSTADAANAVAQGDRSIAVVGLEYLVLELRDRGRPIELVYPVEGTPLISGGAGVIVDAPHPNAARLFISWLFSRDGQQLLVDDAFLRSVDPSVQLKAGMKPMSEIKAMQPDPAAQEQAAAEIKKKYDEYFGL